MACTPLQQMQQTAPSFWQIVKALSVRHGFDSCRQALMEHLLLPCLQYAPQDFISDIIEESIKDLMDIINSKLGGWQPLR